MKTKTMEKDGEVEIGRKRKREINTHNYEIEEMKERRGELVVKKKKVGKESKGSSKVEM